MLGGSWGTRPESCQLDEAALVVLASAEQAARTSDVFQELYYKAELDEFAFFGLPTWIEVTAVMQQALTARFLRHLVRGNAQAFSASPAELAADVARYCKAHPNSPLSSSSGDDSTDTEYFARAGSTPGLDLECGGSNALNVDALLDAVRALRLAGAHYDAVHTISLYHKYNRARPGELADGCVVPNAVLFDGTTRERTSLHEFVRAQPVVSSTHQKCPVLVIAGSYS